MKCGGTILKLIITLQMWAYELSTDLYPEPDQSSPY
jgi:hypothetical protein